MKRLCRIVTGLVLGALVLTVTGCEDDLVQNPDFINPDTFYKDNAALQKGVNGIYANLGGESGAGQGRWFNWFYDRYVFEERVGYQVGWEKGPLTFQTGNVSTTDAYIKAFWEISYQSINRANGAIEAAKKLEGQVENPGKRKRLLAEAQFLRGFYYYYLAGYFTSDLSGSNGIPLSLKRTTSTEEPAQQKRSVILDQVIKDASNAASVLPSSYTGSDRGRATKWAAKTLLMKAHLMKKNWSKARTVAEDIMNNSPHNLYSTFYNNWAISHENDSTGGRIFEGQVSASADAAQYSNHHAHFVPPDHEFGQGWHWLWTTQKFRKRYDSNDKRIPGTFLESYMSNRPCDPTKIVNDKGENECQVAKAKNNSFYKVEWSPKKKYFTLGRYGGVVKDKANPNKDSLKYGGGWSRKWVENCGGRGCWFKTEKNIPYLRYSDVLLGHSWAALKGGTANGGNDFANDYGINTLRSKRGLSSVSLTMENLMKEWMKEFAFEQKGYLFLKQISSHGGSNDYLAQWVNDFVNTYNVSRQHKKTDHVLPIPQSEVDANGKVEQHPMWTK